MPRVVHFELQAEKPDRAIKFYKNVFGWEFKKWDGPQEYWLIMTGPESQPGINGGLLQRNPPGCPAVNSIDVPSVDEFTDKVIKQGGTVVMPKMPIPGVGYVAYCADTEGTIFGLFQGDHSVSCQ